jgi:heme/copper-type cytochrome/quinol oxidase subunit 2
MRHRLETCLVGGVLVALALVWYAGTHRRLALAAAAAADHRTIPQFLGIAFVFTVVAFTVITFALASVVAHRHGRSRGPGRGRGGGGRAHGRGAYYPGGGR